MPKCISISLNSQMAGFEILVKIPYIGAPKYIKQFLMEIKDIKREIDSNIVIVGDFDMNG